MQSYILELHFHKQSLVFWEPPFRPRVRVNCPARHSSMIDEASRQAKLLRR